MGKNKTPKPSEQMQNVGATAKTAYESTTKPSQLENELAPHSQNYADMFNLTSGRQMQDYGDIMGGYKGFREGLGGPTKFSYNKVGAKRPEELGEAYGYLRETMPGYRDFATTGGYSDKDVRELRARGIAPIRSAYGNTMMEMDRARALGGPGGAPNYIAAASKAQRELPGQMADAMTTVNAELAQNIRQGKLAGLQGMHGVGQTMGGLSSDEAGRLLQADLANQAADIQTQGMSEASLQNLRQSQLASLAGQTGIYGTTPAMANMFGNQAAQFYGMRGGLEQNRNQYGLGLLSAQLQAANQQQGAQGKPWWQTALGIAGTAAPYAWDYYKGRRNQGIPMYAQDMGGQVVSSGPGLES